MKIFLLFAIPVLTQNIREIDKTLLKVTGNVLSHFFDLVDHMDYHEQRVKNNDSFWNFLEVFE